MNPLQMVLEVGCEEIPSRYVDALASELAERLTAECTSARIGIASLTAGSTPRRLTVWGDVRAQQQERVAEIRGPRLEAAYREGQATAALAGFLRRVGQRPEELTEATVDGKRYVVARRREPALPAAAVLPGAVERAFSSLSLPRAMRWGAGDARFVRPVRWVGLWLDDRVLAVELAGIPSGGTTRGNRTDHPQAVAMGSAAQYLAALESRLGVMLDGKRRRREIAECGGKLALALGGRMDAEPDLLSEVANLVEWPVPFCGEFDPRFLTVPEPVLVTAMKVHQRYFPVLTDTGKPSLLPYFIGVRNGKGEAMEEVRHGNEKVLGARLADAEYFYRQDGKTPLAARRHRLAQVVFHTRLGTYADKVERMQAIFRMTAPQWELGGEEEHQVLRAMDLAKCDLLTHVVEEFPELEGIMGGIYAEQDGEPAEVAAAIRDQYLPRWQGDPIPAGRVGQVLGVIDRADTLVMALAHGIQPTGSEDPFGLRRAALGLGRIWTESAIAPSLGLGELLEQAKAVAMANLEVTSVVALIVRRLKSAWTEATEVDLLDALVAADDRLGTLAARAAWLAERWSETEFGGYLTVAKRVDRVLGERRNSVSGGDYPVAEEAELRDVTDRLAAAAQGMDAWWAEIPAVIECVERFFERVLVMDPDPAVQSRRLGLLARLQTELGRFWDPEQLPARGS